MMSSFDECFLASPCYPLFAGIERDLSQGRPVVLSAPPGTGKSTLIPLALLKRKSFKGKIILLEPRRLAARLVAERMASLLGEKVGETVGIRMRFDQRISAKTRIEVLTEGTLHRLLQRDISLEGYTTLLFDEFHERSIHADLGLALCLHVKRNLRPSLELIVMSATLDESMLLHYLDVADVHTCSVPMYPRTVLYQKDTSLVDQIPQIASIAVSRSKENPENSVLVFLPGMRELRACESHFQSEKKLSISLLHGSLSPSTQAHALLREPNKVILATSIAETSITIPSVATVIDSGYGKISRFDHGSGFSHLNLERISVASAEQRAGRTGRVGPGTCIRMWSEATHRFLPRATEPEILRDDLSRVLLDLTVLGESFESLSWIDKPPEGGIAAACELLAMLGLVDNSTLTTYGKRVAAWAVHPRIGALLMAAEQRNVLYEGALLASILEGRSTLAFQGDLEDALEPALSTGSLSSYPDGIQRTFRHYCRMLNLSSSKRSFAYHGDTFSLLLAAAYPDRLALLREPGSRRYLLASGRGAVLSKNSKYGGASALAVGSITLKKDDSSIIDALPLSRGYIETFHGINERRTVTLREDTLVPVVALEKHIGALVVSATPAQERTIEDLRTALSLLKREQLPFYAGITLWISRIRFLIEYSKDMFENSIFDNLIVDDTYIQSLIDGVIAENLRTRKSFYDLKDEEISPLLLSQLPFDLQAKIRKEAPSVVLLEPLQRSFKVDYSTLAAPRIAAKIQDLFGVTRLPCLAQGRIPLTIELLSPARRPVQITDDLEGFWKRGYREIRQELRLRYPKHSWPEDPVALPTKPGGKPNNKSS
jgi:ATP-dependent helicase HrpB